MKRDVQNVGGLLSYLARHQLLGHLMTGHSPLQIPVFGLVMFITAVPLCGRITFKKLIYGDG
jgi:hypothetical protein